MPPCHSFGVQSRYLSVGLILAIGLSLGCRSSARDRPPAAPEVAFEKRLNENGAVTFRSYEGKAYRMNSDVELAFYPDHSVQMLDWGLTLTHYSGHYAVDR